MQQAHKEPPKLNSVFAGPAALGAFRLRPRHSNQADRRARCRQASMLVEALVACWQDYAQGDVK
jgi:hypothetical protein